MGRVEDQGHLLRARFVESDRGRRRSVPNRQDRQTQSLGALEGWPVKYDTCLEKSAVLKKPS